MYGKGRSWKSLRPRCLSTQCLRTGLLRTWTDCPGPVFVPLSRPLLHVDADQRPAAGAFGNEIAHKTLIRPELNVAGALATINQHAADGSLVGVLATDLLKAVILCEFFRSLLGVNGLRTRIDDPRTDHGFLYVAPAKAARMGFRAI